jgi:hypothetical protein
VQSYGSKLLDASLLMMPLVGFLPADDPRVLGTVAAIERRLMTDGFVARYETSPEVDGLPPQEGAFLACTYWYVDNLTMQGRVGEARDIFERLLSIRNDVGLWPRSTTRRRSASWATSRRHSRTSRWSTRPTTSRAPSARPSTASRAERMRGGGGRRPTRPCSRTPARRGWEASRRKPAESGGAPPMSLPSPAPPRLRFTLGQVMIGVAVSAVLCSMTMQRGGTIGPYGVLVLRSFLALVGYALATIAIWSRSAPWSRPRWASPAPNCNESNLARVALSSFGYRYYRCAAAGGGASGGR